MSDRDDLKEARKALESMIFLAHELLSPPRSHPGACGPESGCDGACMELAAIGETVRRARSSLAALSRLEAQANAGSPSIPSVSADLAEALRQVQWGSIELDGDGRPWSLCPLCDQSEARGHAPDCLVGMALEEYDAAVQSRENQQASDEGAQGGRARLSLSKEQWIEKYGGQSLLDWEGFEVVPCLNCDDSICHGWRVQPKQPTPPVAKCDKCGRSMSDAEGGKIFTVCDACWPTPPVECPHVAQVFQLISGGIGLMNHSEAQQTILRWWNAVRPELERSLSAPCPTTPPVECPARKALENARTTFEELLHLEEDDGSDFRLPAEWADACRQRASEINALSTPCPKCPTCDSLRETVKALEEIRTAARQVVAEQQKDGSGHPEDVENLRNVLDGYEYAHPRAAGGQ